MTKSLRISDGVHSLMKELADEQGTPLKYYIYNLILSEGRRTASGIVTEEKLQDRIRKLVNVKKEVEREKARGVERRGANARKATEERLAKYALERKLKRKERDERSRDRNPRTEGDTGHSQDNQGGDTSNRGTLRVAQREGSTGGETPRTPRESKEN